jgi:uncharacterized protein YgiM (DUF1202 family)
MRITDPVLVADVSLWQNHLNVQELVDGGVVSVIVGLYKQWNAKQNKYVLNDNCLRMADQVATDGRLVLQSYYYYYAEKNPISESDWFLNAMKGYPVKFAWADIEDVDSLVTPAERSEQARRFALELHNNFPQSGVYTANWYVSSWASAMNQWLPLYLSWVPEYAYQPAKRTMMDWATLKANWLPQYNIILAPGQSPNLVRGHQFTGDRDLLPGVYDSGLTLNAILYKNRMPLDVSVFSKAFIDGLRGNTPPPAPAPVPVPGPAYPAYITTVTVNVRNGPSQTSTLLGILAKGTQVNVDTVDSSGYSHFIPNQLFTVGGWIWSAYIKKI